jgi:hypothetical protein
LPAIAREREGQFLILFVLFFLASLGLVVWYEVRHETGDDGWDTAIAIGMGMSYCVVISTALAYVIVEGAAMLAEQFNKKRYAAGLAEGEVRGEAKGHATRQKEWEAWNERREEAEANGQTFDEPPPALDKRG